MSYKSPTISPLVTASSTNPNGAVYSVDVAVAYNYLTVVQVATLLLYAVEVLAPQK